MKKITLLMPLVASINICVAQSKQIKMYLQQIEANAVYVGYLKKAVSIAKTGLSTISSVKNGEFKLHDLFFKGLSAVNPKIKNWSKVGEIVSLQVSILKSYKKAYAQVKASGQFTDNELEYMHGVFGKLLDDCGEVLIALTDILSDKTFKMTDDERIKRIDLLHAKMKGNHTFCRKFSCDNLIIAGQRLKENQEVNVSRKLFDLK